MPQPFYFQFIDGRLVRMRGLPPAHLLPAAPPQLALSTNSASRLPMAHPRLSYIDGSHFEIGQHLGSGIDKAAYELIDENGEPRTDVVLKVARHDMHCDDSDQCRNEIDLWEWLVSVDHPLRGMFAAIEAIVENVTVPSLGSYESRTCYLCEYVRRTGALDPEMFEVKAKLLAYFGVYDLHQKNVGMTEDGRYVVLDYGLFAGFDRVKQGWQKACDALGDDATPQQVLEEVEPINTLNLEASSPHHWCDECDAYVSETHCHCTECNRERDGGDICYECNTITREESRLSETCEHVRCHTCLSLAKENRHPSQCHPEETCWKMHLSCDCRECRNARLCFKLAEGRRIHTYPATKWAYRPQCPCQWCCRARSENARLYLGMRVSVHRLESAPPLERPSNWIPETTPPLLPFIKDIGGKS